MSDPQLPPEWEHELPSAAFSSVAPISEPGTGPRPDSERDPWTERRTASRMRQALGAARQAIGDVRSDSAPPQQPPPVEAVSDIPRVVVSEENPNRSISQEHRDADTGAKGAGYPPPPEVRPPNAPRPAPPKPAAPLVMDIRPARVTGNDAVSQTETAYGIGEQWGLTWEESAQGWVGRDSSSPTWRPILATTEELTEWEIETYLGVVTAEVGVEQRGADMHRLGDTLARGRDLANRGLLSEALNRGAHAVVGVRMQYTPLGERILITLTGTAVTLRDRS